MVGPESLSGVLAPTILGRPDIDRVHVGAEQAFETAGAAHPHMVVIDLPRGEAVSLVQCLRASPATRPTAIVWLSRGEPREAETELAVAGRTRRSPFPSTPSCGTAGSRSS